MIVAIGYMIILLYALGRIGLGDCVFGLYILRRGWIVIVYLYVEGHCEGP